jgi:hypothetical protein
MDGGDKIAVMAYQSRRLKPLYVIDALPGPGQELPEPGGVFLQCDLPGVCAEIITPYIFTFHSHKSEYFNHYWIWYSLLYSDY